MVGWWVYRHDAAGTAMYSSADQLVAKYKTLFAQCTTRVDYTSSWYTVPLAIVVIVPEDAAGPLRRTWPSAVPAATFQSFRQCPMLIARLQQPPLMFQGTH